MGKHHGPSTYELEVLTSDPGSPGEGEFWYNSTDKCLKLRDGAVTQTFSGAMSNQSSSVDPDADNDVTEGYSIGSHWFNTTSDEAFVCVDATDTAAVWLKVGPDHAHSNKAVLDATTASFLIADESKLDGIDTGATDDQTGAEIKTAYEGEANTNAFTDADESKLDGINAGAEVNPDVVPQAEAEAGTATTERIWTAQRVAQSIAALETGGGGSAVTVEDEGTPLTTDVTKLNFAGAGVTVTEPVADEMLVTIPGGGGAATLGSVTARRTTAYTLTTAFADLTLGTSDVETDNSIVSHDDTNRERVVAQETGTYLVSYHMLIDDGGSDASIFSGQVEKNGTTLIAQSSTSATQDQSSQGDVPVILTKTFAVSLTANDYITLQAKASSIADGQTVSAGAILTVIKLDGVAGATGPTGADGDITWESAWVTATSYTANQAVENDGSAYVCILNHTSGASSEPGVGGSWTTYWDLMAAKGSQGPAGNVIEYLPIFMHNGDEKTEVSATYVSQCQMLFRGSTEAGTPNNIKAILSVNAGTSGACRVYDVTNSLVIAEVTGKSNTTAAVTDLGTISNVPTGAAVWEVQVKNDGVNATIIGGLSMRY